MLRTLICHQFVNHWIYMKRKTFNFFYCQHAIANLDDKLTKDLTKIDAFSALTWINVALHMSITKCLSKNGKVNMKNFKETLTEESISKMRDVTYSRQKQNKC